MWDEDESNGNAAEHDHVDQQEDLDLGTDALGHVECDSSQQA